MKNIFHKFGYIGKVFFCSEKKFGKKPKDLNIPGIFGWIEFTDKIRAKIASNFFKRKNKQLKHKFFNLKCYYLKNFKWYDLENFLKKKFSKI